MTSLHQLEQPDYDTKEIEFFTLRTEFDFRDEYASLSSLIDMRLTKTLLDKAARFADAYMNSPHLHTSCRTRQVKQIVSLAQKKALAVQTSLEKTLDLIANYERWYQHVFTAHKTSKVLEKHHLKYSQMIGRLENLVQNQPSFEHHESAVQKLTSVRKKFEFLKKFPDLFFESYQQAHNLQLRGTPSDYCVFDEQLQFVREKRESLQSNYTLLDVISKRKHNSAVFDLNRLITSCKKTYRVVQSVGSAIPMKLKMYAAALLDKTLLACKTPDNKLFLVDLSGKSYYTTEALKEPSYLLYSSPEALLIRPGHQYELNSKSLSTPLPVDISYLRRVTRNGCFKLALSPLSSYHQKLAELFPKEPLKTRLEGCTLRSRIAVLSDIHGNIDALKAVEIDLNKMGSVSQYYILGDIVGYGAFPNECLEWVLSKKDARVVLGNHEFALLNPSLAVKHGNSHALSSWEWTHKEIGAAGLQKLRFPVVCLDKKYNALLAHGGLMGPYSTYQGEIPLETIAQTVWTYMLPEFFVKNRYDSAITQSFRSLYLSQDVDEGEPVSFGFFGHTHIQGGFTAPAEGEFTEYVEVEHSRFSERNQVIYCPQTDGRSHFWINPGTVGLPRGGRGIGRAYYALFEQYSDRVSERRYSVVTFCTAPYDVVNTASSMNAKIKLRDPELARNVEMRMLRGV